MIFSKQRRNYNIHSPTNALFNEFIFLAVYIFAEYFRVNRGCVKMLKDNECSGKTKEIQVIWLYNGTRSQKIKTHEIIIEARNIMRIPYYQKKELVIEQALYHNADLIYLIPKEMLSSEIIEKTVMRDYKCLRFLPEAMITKDLAMKVIEKEYYGARYIPRAMIEELLTIVDESTRYRIIADFT